MGTALKFCPLLNTDSRSRNRHELRNIGLLPLEKAITASKCYSPRHKFSFDGARGLTFSWWGCYSLCCRHKPTELAHSFLFSSCVSFCPFGPFICVSFINFPDNSPLSHSVLLVLFCFIGRFNYIPLYESLLSPDIILCGWLGLKHQVTN